MVQHAFAGIKIGVVALIVDVVIKMWDHSVQNYFGVVLFLVSFLLLAVIELSPIVVIVGSGLIGIIIQIKGINDLDKGSLDQGTDQE
ncbi:hypothetical protein JCM16358_19500 [Halanaerocella petrolearia]